MTAHRLLIKKYQSERFRDWGAVPKRFDWYWRVGNFGGEKYLGWRSSSTTSHRQGNYTHLIGLVKNFCKPSHKSLRECSAILAVRPEARSLSVRPLKSRILNAIVPLNV